MVKNEDKLERLMQYHSYLVQHYPDELLQLYLSHLERQGDYVSDRRQYADLAGTMKIIIRDIPAGKERIIAVAQTLKQKYPRRPAMIDELNSLLIDR